MDKNEKKPTPQKKENLQRIIFVFHRISDFLKYEYSVLGTKVTIAFTIGWIFTVLFPTYFAFETRYIHPRILMDGEINIAVIGFNEIDGNVLSNEEEKLIASAFFNRLVTDFAEFSAFNDLIIQIAGPEDVKGISGKSPEKRKEAAHNRAEQINADIVIYGTIENKEGYLHLQPEFYVRLSSFFEIDDIVGEYLLGEEILIPYHGGVVGPQISANRELSNRADLLTLLTKGLSLYLVHAYEDAYDYFSQAGGIEYWESIEGKEIVYIFQGNAAGKSMYLDEAQVAYQKAVDLAPELSRGYIGLGNIYFLQYFQNQLDSGYLEKALTSYDQAMKAKDQPEIAFTTEKAKFGKGQIYLTKWFLKEDTLDLAKESFRYVIDQYQDEENDRLKEYAAEAFSRLALIEKYQGNLDGAIIYYQNSISLAEFPGRRAIYYEQLADLFQDSGSSIEAQVNYKKAIDESLIAASLSLQSERKAEYFEKIADLYAKLGETAKAILYLENAVELFLPDDPQRESLQDRIDQLQMLDGGEDDA